MAAGEKPRASVREPDAADTPLPCGRCGCTDSAEAPVEDIPDWRRRLDPDRVQRLDVRPVLAAGDTPFSLVLQAAEDTRPGSVLMIEAPFDPKPLRSVLAGRGFATYAERPGPGHWQIWCLRGQESAGGPEREKHPPSEARIWRSGEVVHIDVRGLEAPRPLVAILALIEGGAHSGHVVVHHNREPLYLYPELEERGWRYSRLPSPEGEVRIELRGPA